MLTPTETTMYEIQIIYGKNKKKRIQWCKLIKLICVTQVVLVLLELIIFGFAVFATSCYVHNSICKNYECYYIKTLTNTTSLWYFPTIDKFKLVSNTSLITDKLVSNTSLITDKLNNNCAIYTNSTIITNTLCEISNTPSNSCYFIYYASYIHISFIILMFGGPLLYSVICCTKDKYTLYRLLKKKYKSFSCKEVSYIVCCSLNRIARLFNFDSLLL
jgi:hypothetical protein